MKRLKAAVVIAALSMSLSACSGSAEQSFAGTEVAPPFTVANIEVATASGTPFTFPDDLDHRLNILFFGYTHCPDVCPVVLGSLASGLLRLEPADRAQVAVYFVTSDPKRDSGQKLSKYLMHFDESFVGLRGDIESTAELGKSVGIFVDEGQRLATGGYDPNAHSTYVIGLDGSGHAPVFWNMDTSPSEFAHDIEFMLGS